MISLLKIIVDKYNFLTNHILDPVGQFNISRGLRFVNGVSLTSRQLYGEYIGVYSHM